MRFSKHQALEYVLVHPKTKSRLVNEHNMIPLSLVFEFNVFCLTLLHCVTFYGRCLKEVMKMWLTLMQSKIYEFVGQWEQFWRNLAYIWPKSYINFGIILFHSSY